MNEKGKKKSADEIKELKAFYDAYLKRIKLGVNVYTKYRALSKEEKKKLLKLKEYEAGVSNEQLLLNTTQKSIPFKKMYEDGICQVTDTFFTKMVEFDDINYELLEVEERGEVLEEYSKFINYFDPSIKFQLFFFNRKVSEEKLRERFEMIPQGDDFDDIREEFAEMLKNQSAKGNNGIIKSKYVIFGKECESYEDARSKLENISKDVVRNLNNMGARARRLDGYERLEILHEYFVQSTKETFDFDFQKAYEEGRNEKDYISPQSFDFTEKNSFKTGKTYGKTYYLDVTCSRFNDGFFKNLLAVDGNFSVSVHMQSLDPVRALKWIKEELTRIQASKIDEQKKAFRQGYDMDILPPDIVTYEQDALELINDLNTSNQKLFHFTLLITVFGKSMKKLTNVFQNIYGVVQQANCELVMFDYLQEQGFFSSAPLLSNSFPKERLLTTKTIAIMIPFNTQELFMDEPAVYYGLNALSNNMILADRKRLRTPNGLILGTPGSGKSFSAKREILSCFLTTRDEIIICDPEGEYYPIVEALNGQVVRLATNSTAYLNPMDIQLSHKGDKEAIQLKSAFIITLMDLIAGGTNGLGNDEKGIIDECIRHIYDKYFEDPTPEKMPVLANLYEELLRYDPRQGNPFMEEHLCVEARKQAVRIANSLNLYANGSQNYFNHRTNVDSDNRILCFDIRDLSNQLKEIGMLIVQDAVWNRVSKNRERKLSTRYYCDEFHLLLREKQTADYSIEMWKRFRKWGGIPTGLTQNVTDFLKSPDIEGIIGNSDFIYLLNTGKEDREILKKAYSLSEGQLSHITNAEAGCGLIIFDNYIIPFVDRYPQNTKTFAIMNTRPEGS